MNLTTELSKSGIAKDLAVLRNTNPSFAELLRILEAHQTYLLRETMKSGCFDATASELRYRARGIEEVLQAVNKL